MSDWDEDGEQLRSNLRRVFLQARDDSLRRLIPSIEQARSWQAAIMRGLTSPSPEQVGRFRGEPGLESCEVAIGTTFGVSSHDVAAALASFEERLQRTVEALDRLVLPTSEITADDVAAVIDLCAWAHSEWVRIHPFANGNGRTARLWANVIAMRYGLPPFVRLRPRPNDDYAPACAQAMDGRWQPMVRVFRRMYREMIAR